jgi:hypothetical protein
MKYLKFVDSNGKPQAQDSSFFTALDNGAGSATYYAELGLNNLEWAGIGSMHWDWDATLAATITIEATNHYDVPLHTAVGARWIDIAAITDVVAATSASQDIASWADIGYGRMRAKVVVTADGNLRGAFHVKKKGGV